MNKHTRLEVLIGRDEIADAVNRMAAQICADYQTKNPLLVGILKGSFVFIADLVRCLDFPLEVDFIRLSSYGAATQTSGKVTVIHELPTPVINRHVLIVEDIVDSGLTTNFLYEYLAAKSPASLRLCSLADKPSRRRVPINIDYRGFVVPDRFIVGYGIDYKEQFRNLPDICLMEDR